MQSIIHDTTFSHLIKVHELPKEYCNCTDVLTYTSPRDDLLTLIIASSTTAATTWGWPTISTSDESANFFYSSLVNFRGQQKGLHATMRLAFILVVETSDNMLSVFSNTFPVMGFEIPIHCNSSWQEAISWTYLKFSTTVTLSWETDHLRLFPLPNGWWESICVVMSWFSRAGGSVVDEWRLSTTSARQGINPAVGSSSHHCHER